MVTIMTDRLIRLEKVKAELVRILRSSPRSKDSRSLPPGILVRVRREYQYQEGCDDSRRGDCGAKSADGAYLNGFYSGADKWDPPYYISRADVAVIDAIMAKTKTEN